MKLLVGYLIDGRHSGIDKYLLSLLEQAAREGVRMDFLTNKIDPELKERLDLFGSELYEIPTLKTPFSQYKAVRRIVELGNYDGAYFNISEPLNMIGLLAAHRCGLTVKVHSHNSAPGSENAVMRFVRSCICLICRPIVNSCADLRLACSGKAAKWLFGSRAKDTQIIYNPVDEDRFAFAPYVRERVREEMGLAEATVVCHVGNLLYAKNQSFLLDVFAKIAENCNHAELLLVGSGPDEQMLRDKTAALGLEDKVRFLGVRSDIDELYQAADVFVFPSRNEGLPIAALEAQFSGLPCLISTEITGEALIAANAAQMSLREPASEWAQKAIDMSNEPRGAAQIPAELSNRFSRSHQDGMLRNLLLDDWRKTN